MLNPFPFFSLLSRVLCIILPSVAINILKKRRRVNDETESVVTKRRRLIDEPDITKRRRIMDEREFDVIIVDDDDDDEQLRNLLCSEKLSPVFDVIDDDDMPIVIDDDDDDKDTAGVSVGVTRSTIMVAGSSYIPKLNKEKPLGEDASFICAKEQTIGVADGVGGWAKKGIDSGEYSRELMKNVEFAIRNNKSSSIDLMKILNEAYSKTKAKGSSTACILTLANDTLQAVNVGDSGFVVIRHGIIVYKSKIQQSRFNCPFQLGNASKSDDPSVAQKISFPVIAGDVIVLGTDGLFDNVHDFELETLVNSAVDTWKSDVPGTLAWRIAVYALDNAKSRDLYTPFTRECSKAGIGRNGGKYDDITVIVAHIWRRLVI